MKTLWRVLWALLRFGWKVVWGMWLFTWEIAWLVFRVSFFFLLGFFVGAFLLPMRKSGHHE